MLYPAELRAHSSSLTGNPAGRGRRIRTADPLLPKQLRYQTAPCPVSQAFRPSDPGQGRVARGCDDTGALVGNQGIGSVILPDVHLPGARRIP